ncbi:DUF523 domain-containing protein [Candidatus Galacturonibacter soehngenii]|uniref:DUF523 domain-containing protein n=1 Tax=Candidatus Galacturonatibacter soehngenii TaxID=2307010 RepID=A0A7V7QKZ9_9FIRM|nr:DUF523 domain-containing protein [Candidatus Galacturonibacter soehngenii]KAB1438565.1 DUF523 domain-containing protein [Candidatus Galacturonibacter soehngenii]MBA4685601.1 DUF523 domain-containing protein [Candidatus Galacturonibacter soehngenii]
MNILISACLLGIECRYDGTGKKIPELEQLKKKHHLIPICPEIFGGLPTPREPAEKVGNRIMTKTGKDVTDYYQKGADEVLKLANLFDCKYAILKERSPSCGYGEIYDGTFTGQLIKGDGVLANLLAQNGITILGEKEIKLV